MIFETDPGVIRIDWREAEQLLGHRVDHRVAYFRQADNVLVYGWHGERLPWRRYELTLYRDSDWVKR